MRWTTAVPLSLLVMWGGCAKGPPHELASCPPQNVKPLVDPFNCGNCNVRCAELEACVSGYCNTPENQLKPTLTDVLLMVGESVELFASMSDGKGQTLHDTVDFATTDPEVVSVVGNSFGGVSITARKSGAAQIVVFSTAARANVAVRVVEPLMIVSHNLTPAGGLGVLSQMVLTFDRALDPSTLNTGTAVLTLPDGGTWVPSMSAADTTLVLTNPEPLIEFNSKYRLQLSPTLGSLDGRRLGRPQTIAFETAFWDPNHLYQVENVGEPGRILALQPGSTGDPEGYLEVGPAQTPQQSWFFLMEQVEGYFSMNSQSTSTGKSLEGADGTRPVFLFGNGPPFPSSQLWRPVAAPPAPGQPQRYLLRTQSFGDSRSLDKDATTLKVVMATHQDFTHKYWTFTRLGHR